MPEPRKLKWRFPEDTYLGRIVWVRTKSMYRKTLWRIYWEIDVPARGGPLAFYMHYPRSLYLHRFINLCEAVGVILNPGWTDEVAREKMIGLKCFLEVRMHKANYGWKWARAVVVRHYKETSDGGTKPAWTFHERPAGEYRPPRRGHRTSRKERRERSNAKQTKLRSDVPPSWMEP